MQGYIGYIRVSTVKQGTKGVSLQEQRDAISRYAQRNQMSISTWLEEMETAAKQGRPIFNQALKLLRGRKARGIILHKLDRGARNLRDWTEIGDLSDQGVEVHFVTESLDLQSRGGRLSADIQAVVSADYIRNLREEARKGFYGRLKQGIYPLRAPIGYLDQGSGQVKAIDPMRAPLVRKAFELYATGGFSLETLSEEMTRLGLCNTANGPITINRLSITLNNPFYFGLIRVKSTGETFAGKHKPLIRKSLFDRVQAVLQGKFNTRSQQHRFPFRRLLKCGSCGYSLTGEIQKGNVYYRCHSKQCPITSIREDLADTAAGKFLRQFQFNNEEKAYFRAKVLKMRQTWTTHREEEAQGLKLRISQSKDRLNRLTDAYIDTAIDKAMFEERKKGLLLEQKDLEGNLADLLSGERPFPDRLEKFLELTMNAVLSHQKGNSEEKREMVETFTSNRTVHEKKLDLRPSTSFLAVADRFQNAKCGVERDIPRTWDRLIDDLETLNKQGLLPDLDSLSAFQKDDITEEKAE